MHIGFADTLSAGSAQAFTLSENNLYTVEAFNEYFDHLRPDGILDVSRPRRLVGDEGLRVTVLALEALRERGRRAPRAQRGRGARARHPQRALRHDARAHASLDAGRAGPIEAAGPGAWRGRGVRPGRPVPLRVGGPGAASVSRGLLLVLPAGRVRPHRQQAVLLPDAPAELTGQRGTGLHLCGRAVPGTVVTFAVLAGAVAAAGGGAARAHRTRAAPSAPRRWPSSRPSASVS